LPCATRAKRRILHKTFYVKIGQPHRRCVSGLPRHNTTTGLHKPLAALQRSSVADTASIRQVAPSPTREKRHGLHAGARQHRRAGTAIATWCGRSVTFSPFSIQKLHKKLRTTPYEIYNILIFIFLVFAAYDVVLNTG